MESFRIAVLVPPRVAIREGKSQWGVVAFAPTDEQLAELTVPEREALAQRRHSRGREQKPLRIETATVQWEAIVAALRGEIEDRERRLLDQQRRDEQRRAAIPRVAECMRPLLPESGHWTDEQVVNSGLQFWTARVIESLHVDPVRVRRLQIGTGEWNRIKLIPRRTYSERNATELQDFTSRALCVLPPCFLLMSHVVRVVTRKRSGTDRVLPYTACVLVLGTSAGHDVALLVRSDDADQ